MFRERPVRPGATRIPRERNDIAMRRLQEACETLSSVDFPAPLAGDDADAVALADDEVQVPERGVWRRNATLRRLKAAMEESHWCSALVQSFLGSAKKSGTCRTRRILFEFTSAISRSKS